MFEYIRDILFNRMRVDVVRAVLGDRPRRKITSAEKAMIVSTLLDKFSGFYRYPCAFTVYRPVTSPLIQKALLMFNDAKRLFYEKE